MRHRDASPERGAVTIHALTAGGFLALIALVIVQATMLIRLQHQVSMAADLSALAASRASSAGDDGCAAARALARRNHVRIRSCRMDFDVATVIARGESRAIWGHRYAVESKARAAPAAYLDG